jgi:hypothetical protein
MKTGDSIVIWSPKLMYLSFGLGNGGSAIQLLSDCLGLNGIGARVSPPFRARR